MTTDVERLVMRLAENKAATRQVTKEIKSLMCDGERFIDIDLSKYRDHWNYFGYSWKGWVKAVTHFEGDVGDEVTVEEMKMAELLDKKKALRYELGIIRRALCTVGRRLLRDA